MKVAFMFTGSGPLVIATSHGSLTDAALLDINPVEDSWQSLYHFTVGGAVDDKRLTTHSPYGHLGSERISQSRRRGVPKSVGRPA